MNKILKNLASVFLTGYLAFNTLVNTGCTKLNPVTDPVDERQIEYNEVFSNPGEFLFLNVKNTQKENVVIKYKFSGEQDYKEVEGSYAAIPMEEGKFGNLEIMVLENGIETLKQTIPVYMGENDACYNLEKSLEELKVPVGVNKGDITGYSQGCKVTSTEFNPIYFNQIYVVDKIITIYCRGPPDFKGFCFIDIQGSNQDVPQNITPQSLVGTEGYLFINKVLDGNNIITQILQKKSEGWGINPY